MFKVGDKVVYPQHGAGIITDKKKVSIMGEEKEYFVLHINIDDMDVMIPADNIESSGLRYVMSKEEMKEIIDILKDERSKMSKNWNKRFRNNLNKIKEGNIEEIAEVAKNLELLDDEKSLSTGERKILNSAKQILISEIIVVYDIDYDQAEKMLMQAIHD